MAAGNKYENVSRVVFEQFVERCNLWPNDNRNGSPLSWSNALLWWSCSWHKHTLDRVHGTQSIISTQLAGEVRLRWKVNCKKINEPFNVASPHTHIGRNVQTAESQNETKQTNKQTENATISFSRSSIWYCRLLAAGCCLILRLRWLHSNGPKLMTMQTVSFDSQQQTQVEEMVVAKRHFSNWTIFPLRLVLLDPPGVSVAFWWSNVAGSDCSCHHVETLCQRTDAGMCVCVCDESTKGRPHYIDVGLNNSLPSCYCHDIAFVSIFATLPQAAATFSIVLWIILVFSSPITRQQQWPMHSILGIILFTHRIITGK